MTLRISDKLSLPDDSALWTFADLAIKGAGKTYAASVMAEEMVKAGIPIIALDGLGVWWGLRVGVDGHEGLPIVIFGGAHKDISIPIKSDKSRIVVVDEEKLKLMVKAILEARMSAVLDTSEFSKGMQRRIVAIFVNELYHLNQPYGTRHVFIEEADLWCPQRLPAREEWASAAMGAIDDLVRRGGNFNLGCTLITQRSAVLNKDVLTQINCLIVLRILHKLDKQAVHTWVESMAQPDDRRISKWYDSLAGLENGEAWVWHPEAPVIFERIQFRKRETLHATREYFRQAEFEQKDVRLMDVDSFVQKFKKVFEPAIKAPVPAPVRQEPIPIATRIARDTTPLSAPKAISEIRAMKYESTRPNPLASDPSFSSGLKIGANEGLEAAAKKIEEINFEEKALVIRVNHSEKAVSMDTNSQKGQIIYALLQRNQTLMPKGIMEEMQEHGWYIAPSSFSNTAKEMVSEGLLVKNENGSYRLPKFVRFEAEEIPA